MDDDHFESQDQQPEEPAQRCGAPEPSDCISVASWITFREEAQESDGKERGQREHDRSSEKPDDESELEHTGPSSSEPIDWLAIGALADGVVWADVTESHRHRLSLLVVHRRFLEALYWRLSVGSHVTTRQRPGTWAQEAARRGRRAEAALQAAEANGDTVVRSVRCTRRWRFRPKS